jgi:hypothetical protein
MISLLPSNLSGDCGTSLNLEKKTDFFKFQADFKVTVSHNKSQWLQERTLNFARIWTPICMQGSFAHPNYKYPP